MTFGIGGALLSDRVWIEESPRGARSCFRSELVFIFEHFGHATVIWECRRILTVIGWSSCW